MFENFVQEYLKIYSQYSLSVFNIALLVIALIYTLLSRKIAPFVMVNSKKYKELNTISLEIIENDVNKVKAEWESYFLTYSKQILYLALFIMMIPNIAYCILNKDGINANTTLFTMVIALAEYIDNKAISKKKMNVASSHHLELMKDAADLQLFEMQDKVLEDQERSGKITNDMATTQRKMLAEDINKYRQN